MIIVTIIILIVKGFNIFLTISEIHITSQEGFYFVMVIVTIGNIISLFDAYGCYISS